MPVGHLYEKVKKPYCLFRLWLYNNQKFYVFPYYQA